MTRVDSMPGAARRAAELGSATTSVVKQERNKGSGLNGPLHIKPDERLRGVFYNLHLLTAEIVVVTAIE